MILNERTNHYNVRSDDQMTPEDRLILYTVLHDIADELRRLGHESKKEQREKDPEHPEERKPQTRIQYGVSKR